LISFAGRLSENCTRLIRGEPAPCDAAGWLEELQKGAAPARFVADELDKAAGRLRQNQTELPAAMTVREFRETYDAYRPGLSKWLPTNRRARQRAVQVGSFRLTVKLPIHDLGQSLLNLATEPEPA
jgi:hypothetical protein